MSITPSQLSEPYTVKSVVEMIDSWRGEARRKVPESVKIIRWAMEELAEAEEHIRLLKREVEALDQFADVLFSRREYAPSDLAEKYLGVMAQRYLESMAQAHLDAMAKARKETMSELKQWTLAADKRREWERHKNNGVSSPDRLPQAQKRRDQTVQDTGPGSDRQDRQGDALRSPDGAAHTRQVLSTRTQTRATVPN